MAPVGHSLNKSQSSPFICELLHSRLNSANLPIIRFLFIYHFINITLLPISTNSKWYRQGIVYVKVNPHCIRLCTSALPPKQCKTFNNPIFIYLYFYKHYSTSIFDEFEMEQVLHRLNKIQSSLHSLVHFRPPA